MTYIDYRVFADDATTYTAFVTGGTGNFEGISGTGTFAAWGPPPGVTARTLGR